MAKKTSVAELASLLGGAYSHLELGSVNDHAAYLMNFKGEYAWHHHPSDELYFVLEGEITVRFRNAPTEKVCKGECITVPAYMGHSSQSEGALVLMVKPKDMFPRPQDME